MTRPEPPTSPPTAPGPGASGARGTSGASGTSGPAAPTDAAGRARPRRLSVLVGLPFGVGLAAAVDEIVFHQLLHWHHFVDRGTTELGLVSDGVLHAVSSTATVASLFLLADLRRRGSLRWGDWVAGVLLGTGAFQLWDGTVHHKLLGVHQVRYVDDLLPYDLAWNGAGALLLVAGAAVLVARLHR